MTRQQQIEEKAREIAMPCQGCECEWTKEKMYKQQYCKDCAAQDRFISAIEMAQWTDDNPKDKITTDEIWDFCSKTSAEWWQVVMDKWNTLSKEEQDRYNQFIGFNDFSDYLMNIMAGALMQLNNTGKLVYEEGSLLLEKEEPKHYDIAYDSMKGE